MGLERGATPRVAVCACARAVEVIYSGPMDDATEGLTPSSPSGTPAPLEGTLPKIDEESYHRCTAHRTKPPKDRCKRSAVRGSTVCVKHGAGAPQVRRAAQLRMLALIDPAISGLARALRVRGQCAVCGRSDDMDLVVKAARIALDRTGFGPSSSLELMQTGEKPGWLKYLTNEQVSTVMQWIAEAKAREQAIDVTPKG
jgi:hypothetical protein